MTRTFITLTSIALFAACGGSSGSAGGQAGSGQVAVPPKKAPPKVPDIRAGKIKQVFKGPSGIVVSIVLVEPEESGKAIIRVDGVVSEIAGLALLHESGERGQGEGYYHTTLHGQQHTTVLEDENRWYKRVLLTLPENVLEHHPLRFSEVDTEELDGARLVAEHKELVRSGKIAELQKFNRRERELRQERELAERYQGVEKACGARVESEVVWSSVSDDVIKGYSLAGYCDAAAGALEKLCTRFPDRKGDVARQVKKISCRWGSKPNINLAGDGTLEWTTAPEGNLADIAWSKLPGEFGLEKIVMATGDGHHFILDVADDGGAVYYGQNGSYQRQRQYRSSSWGHRYLWSGDQTAELSFDEGNWSLQCGKKETVLSVLGEAAQKKVLAAAKLEELAFQREPYILARNTSGIYYFVDRVAPEYGEPQFRVFRGKRGKLVEVNVTEAVQGEYDSWVLALADGQLYVWSEGGGSGYAGWAKNGAKEGQNLSVLPLNRNKALIYGKKGVYASVDLGTPCRYTGKK